MLNVQFGNGHDDTSFWKAGLLQKLEDAVVVIVAVELKTLADGVVDAIADTVLFVVKVNVDDVVVTVIGVDVVVVTVTGVDVVVAAVIFEDVIVGVVSVVIFVQLVNA